MENIKTASMTGQLVNRFTARSVGKKYLMAISGIFLVLYIIGHMLGNWQIYMGQDQINTYAETLHNLGPVLWTARIFLFAMLVIHVWFAIQLSLENNSARPVKYKKKNYVEATLSSRTMIWTGIGLFLFVVYHVMQFTLIITNPEYETLTDPQGRFDVYSMVIFGFQNYWISGIYIVALAIISYHLVHAARSMFQTVGWNSDASEPFFHRLAIAFAWIIFLGYISIPITVLLGLVKLPEGVSL